MEGKRNAAQIRRELREHLNDPGGYTAFHLPRYAFLLRILEPHLAAPGSQAILDVGLSAFANVLRERYGQRLDTLDLMPADDSPRGFVPETSEAGKHYVFDLNELEHGSTPPDLDQYDVVLFCEVLEHLRISPRYVFPFLRNLLKPNGILIVQTPNAAAIGKRAKLVLGRNPYGPIGDDPSNPLHFREYTLAELRRFGAEAGLVTASASYAAYFDVRYRDPVGRNELEARLWEIAYRLVPPSCRPGMTIVFRRNDSSDNES